MTPDFWKGLVIAISLEATVLGLALLVYVAV